MDILLDATDIEQGKMVFNHIEWDPHFCGLIKTLSKILFSNYSSEYYYVRQIIEWFSK
jgi:hypothetical protein